jgi:hypothetical protein
MDLSILLPSTTIWKKRHSMFPGQGNANILSNMPPVPMIISKRDQKRTAQRHKDRKTERQKDRKTERQRHGGATGS